MQWQNWQKIASRWRFELDAKSGPLEAGDFGENGDFGKNRQRAGDNSDKRPSPLETGNFGENGDCKDNSFRDPQFAAFVPSLHAQSQSGNSLTFIS